MKTNSLHRLCTFPLMALSFALAVSLPQVCHAADGNRPVVFDTPRSGYPRAMACRCAKKLDMDTGGKMGKSRRSMRYEYGNVKPPM